MAVSTIPKGSVSGSITLSDGTGTPVTLSVPFTQGDFSGSDIEAELNEAVPVEARGIFLGLIHGARKYPSVSFTCIMTQFSEASGTGTVADFLLKRAAYSANIGTLGTGRPYTVDIGFTVEGTDFGDAADHTVTFHDVRVTVAFQEGEPNTLSFTGTVYGEISGDLAVDEIS